MVFGIGTNVLMLKQITQVKQYPYCYGYYN